MNLSSLLLEAKFFISSWATEHGGELPLYVDYQIWCHKTHARKHLTSPKWDNLIFEYRHGYWDTPSD